MCIAIYSPANRTPLTLDEFATAAWNNSDGMGLAAARRDRSIEVVRHEKYTTDNVEALYDAYRTAHGAGQPCLLHFRIATSGGETLANTHPFLLPKAEPWPVAVIHNGILSCPSSKTMSDTRWLVEHLLRNLRRNWIQNRPLLECLQELVGRTNKLAFLDGKRRVAILNDSEHEWDDGRWFSNSSYKTHYAPMAGISEEDEWEQYAQWDRMNYAQWDRMNWREKRGPTTLRSVVKSVTQRALTPHAESLVTTPVDDNVLLPERTYGCLVNHNGVTVIMCEMCRRESKANTQMTLTPKEVAGGCCAACGRTFRQTATSPAISVATYARKMREAKEMAEQSAQLAALIDAEQAEQVEDTEDGPVPSLVENSLQEDNA